MEELSVPQIAIAALVGGVVAALITLFVRRRARFIWEAWHNQIGVSGRDQIFGNVRVLWNEQEARNLWLSTVKVTNKSLRDFENVPIQLSVADPAIMLKQTLKKNEQFTVDLHIDPAYLERIGPSEGRDSVLQHMADTVRQFKIPTVNRGDEYTFTFMVAYARRYASV